MEMEINWGFYLYTIIKVLCDLYATEKFDPISVPLPETFLPSMPFSSHLGQIVKEKVQNTVKSKCVIIIFEHFDNLKWKTS
jgi:hypothetical protein